MQKLDTRVKNKNLHGGDETNHGELKPATILEIKNQNQGCRESINGEEAKEGIRGIRITQAQTRNQGS